MDSEAGLAARTPFFSLSTAREWLDEQAPKVTVTRPERFPAKGEAISEAERELRAKRLKDTARIIRETVKAKTVGRPSTVSWQSQDRSELVAALDSDLHER